MTTFIAENRILLMKQLQNLLEYVIYRTGLPTYEPGQSIVDALHNNSFANNQPKTLSKCGKSFQNPYYNIKKCSCAQ